MRSRRLALRSETLAALTADDLANVVGGAEHTLPDPRCILSEEYCLDIRQSLVPCNTNPCTS